MVSTDGNVDAFVEEVDGEEDGQAAVPEVAQGSVAFVVGCLAPDGGCCDASLVEFVGHESGVGDADAEAECSHGRWVPDALAKLLDDLADPHVIGRVDVRERSDVVSGASTERHLPQVETVVDPVVGERHQVLLVDRVPDPELGGDTSVEEVLHGEPVGAFRRRREAEQLPRLQSFEECPIGRRGGVVELVDDDDVEVARVDGVDAGRREALDGCEDVLEVAGPLRAHPQLAERCVVERVAVGEPALFEDLAAMGDEQQSRPWERPGEVAVVDGGHHRLAGAGRGDQQVSVMTMGAGDGDALQHPLLERAECEVGRGDCRRRPVLGLGGALPELVGLEGLEVAARPVGLEDRCHLGDDVGVPGGRQADVPLQTRNHRAVGQVRGSDVGRGLPAGAIEDPCLRVEAGGGLVVRDTHVGAGIGERLERFDLGAVRIGGGEETNSAAIFEVAAKRREHRVDAGEPDERNQDVDRVRRRDLGDELVEYTRLAGCVDEQRAVAQRGEGPIDGLVRAVG